MSSTRSLMYTTKHDRQITFDRNHIAPATTELIQLNSKWQRQIKDEKERRRNACMIAGTESDVVEQSETDENQLVGVIEDNVPSSYWNDNVPLDFRCIVPVTRIMVPNTTTREHIAQQFTLNKNQKAAFMIITGHLDGLNKLNECKLMK